eukprot:TRINITY_DN7806_c3_g1_i1.p1 TRINITY_DN7806_c3_g1~~TRINITY_DN7806_c3_g1_i1.p1  ORF type:complete len:407 (+),score=91.66 TRINITY_DN7806_c3_g1_i1:52-1272(+)
MTEVHEEHVSLTVGGNSDHVRREKARKSLIGALIFCVIFMIAEGVGGYIANSIAVMSDAAHVATDVAALSLSLFALHQSGKPKSSKYSYGWHRVEMVGALISLLSIWFLTIVIVYNSIQRFDWKKQESVDGRLMFILGWLGLFVNICVAVILHFGNAEVMHSHSHGSGGCPSKSSSHGHSHNHGHSHGHGHNHDHGNDTAEHPLSPSNGGGINNDEHGHGHSHGAKDKKKLDFTSAKEGENVNVKSAMIHAIGDCIQSTGVIIASIIIWAGNEHDHGSPDAVSAYNIADPVTSCMFAIVTLWTTHGLFRQVCNVLLESSAGTPHDLIEMDLHLEFGKDNVHDLHMWSITLSKHVLSVHIVSDDYVMTLRRAKVICVKHGIHHSTIQVDSVLDGADKCKSEICKFHI